MNKPLDKYDLFDASVTDDTKMLKLTRFMDATQGFINDLKIDSHNPYATFNKWFGGVLK